MLTPSCVPSGLEELSVNIDLVAFLLAVLCKLILVKERVLFRNELPHISSKTAQFRLIFDLGSINIK